jgi:DNA-binding NarL/FixJ family response regulator
MRYEGLAVSDMVLESILGLLDGDEILSRTTRILTETFGFHISWIAEPVEGGASIRHAAGNRTNRFEGLVLEHGRGLCGKVLASGKLHAVDDYCASPDITHEYDDIVACEDVRQVIAAPMLAGDRNFGVLLAANRAGGSQDEGGAGIVEGVAKCCAEALFFAERVRAATEAAVYEDRRRMALALHDTVEATLTSIAANVRRAGHICVDDEELRARLRSIESQAEDATASLRRWLHESLAAPVQLAHDGPSALDLLPAAPAPSEPPACGPSIARREYDVLCRVATGETNYEIAAAMNLSHNTIKTYLRNAMSKLGARNRVEAIVRAREMGVL